MSRASTDQKRVVKSRAEVVARLGLHVIEADDLALRELTMGWYAVPSRDAEPIESAIVGPCKTEEEAASAMVVYLAEIQWSRFAQSAGGAS